MKVATCVADALDVLGMLEAASPELAPPQATKATAVPQTKPHATHFFVLWAITTPILKDV
jgi:hypothetical protein